MYNSAGDPEWFDTMGYVILVLYTIAVTSTILRFIYRFRRQQLHWDDFWVFIALLATIYLIVRFILSAFFPVREKSIGTQIVLVWGVYWMHPTALWATRLSIAVTILRFSPPGRTRLLSKISCYLLCVMYILTIIQKVFMCGVPVPLVPYNCRTTRLTPAVGFITNFLANILLIAWPVYILTRMSLQRTYRRIMVACFSASTLIGIINILHDAYFVKREYYPAAITGNVQVALALFLCNTIVLISYIYRVLCPDGGTIGSHGRRGNKNDEFTTIQTRHAHIGIENPRDLESVRSDSGDQKLDEDAPGSSDDSLSTHVSEIEKARRFGSDAAVEEQGSSTGQHSWSRCPIEGVKAGWTFLVTFGGRRSSSLASYSAGALGAGSEVKSMCSNKSKSSGGKGCRKRCSSFGSSGPLVGGAALGGVGVGYKPSNVDSNCESKPKPKTRCTKSSKYRCPKSRCGKSTSKSRSRTTNARDCSDCKCNSNSKGQIDSGRTYSFALGSVVNSMMNATSTSGTTYTGTMSGGTMMTRTTMSGYSMRTSESGYLSGYDSSGYHSGFSESGYASGYASSSGYPSGNQTGTQGTVDTDRCESVDWDGTRSGSETCGRCDLNSLTTATTLSVCEHCASDDLEKSRKNGHREASALGLEKPTLVIDIDETRRSRGSWVSRITEVSESDERALPPLPLSLPLLPLSYTDGRRDSRAPEDATSIIIHQSPTDTLPGEGASYDLDLAEFIRRNSACFSHSSSYYDDSRPTSWNSNNDSLGLGHGQGSKRAGIIDAFPTPPATFLGALAFEQEQQQQCLDLGLSQQQLLPPPRPQFAYPVPTYYGQSEVNRSYSQTSYTSSPSPPSRGTFGYSPSPLGVGALNPAGSFRYTDSDSYFTECHGSAPMITSRSSSLLPPPTPCARTPPRGRTPPPPAPQVNARPLLRRAYSNGPYDNSAVIPNNAPPVQRTGSFGKTELVSASASTVLSLSSHLPPPPSFPPPNPVSTTHSSCGGHTTSSVPPSAFRFFEGPLPPLPPSASTSRTPSPSRTQQPSPFRNFSRPTLSRQTSTNRPLSRSLTPSSLSLRSRSSFVGNANPIRPVVSPQPMKISISKERFTVDDRGVVSPEPSELEYEVAAAERVRDGEGEGYAHSQAYAYAYV